MPTPSPLRPRVAVGEVVRALVEAASSTAASSARRPRPPGPAGSTSRVTVPPKWRRSSPAHRLRPCRCRRRCRRGVGAEDGLRGRGPREPPPCCWPPPRPPTPRASRQRCTRSGPARSPSWPAGGSSTPGANATTKGWRWIAEMAYTVATFGAAGQPDGFHRARCRRLSAMVRDGAGRGGGDEGARHCRRGDG